MHCIAALFLTKNKLIAMLADSNSGTKLCILELIEQKGMHLNHNFYLFVGKQCRTENAKTGHQ